VVQVSRGGPAYGSFRAVWDKRLRVAGRGLRLSTADWPAVLPDQARAGIVLPLGLDRHGARGRGSLALEPIWAVRRNAFFDLDVWVASSVDDWIRWTFTALPNRTARLARPSVELVGRDGVEVVERRLLDGPLEWALVPDQRT